MAYFPDEGLLAEFYGILFSPYIDYQAAKLLDNGRSQTIGIIMSSLSCQLEDIRDAIYKMDTSVIDMDG